MDVLNGHINIKSNSSFFSHVFIKFLLPMCCTRYPYAKYTVWIFVKFGNNKKLCQSSSSFLIIMINVLASGAPKRGPEGGRGPTLNNSGL